MGNIFHEWNGTTLIITSDSGTSGCDLKGDTGDIGVRGPQGEPGIFNNDLAVAELREEIAANTTLIGINTTNIETLSNRVAGQDATVEYHSDAIEKINEDIAINANKIASNTDSINLILNNPDSETIDSITEFVEYIENHGEVATSLQTQITNNKNRIDSVNTKLDKTTETADTALRKANNSVSSTDLIDLIYPIGSIYMSVNNTSPAILFGGFWEQLKDTFLLAAGDNYDAGSTGGEATHTLTINEMPSHAHGLENIAIPDAAGGWQIQQGEATNHYGFDDRNNKLFQTEGGSAAHNNMPPYLTVYMWKRVIEGV